MNFLCFDCETSGFDPKKNALLQVAAIPIINGVKRDHFVSYSAPHLGATLDPKALEVNKITVAQIKTFPDPKEVIKSFIDWIDTHDTMFALLGHNVQFDRRFLYDWFCRHGFYGDFIRRIRPNDKCTEEMARQVFKNKKAKPEGMSLGALCKFFKIELTNAHDALADIEATYELYLNLKSMMPDKFAMVQDLKYLEKRDKFLDRSLIQFNSNGDVYISNLATKDPSAIRFIAEELYNMFGE